MSRSSALISYTDTQLWPMEVLPLLAWNTGGWPEVLSALLLPTYSRSIFSISCTGPKISHFSKNAQPPIKKLDTTLASFVGKGIWRLQSSYQGRTFLYVSYFQNFSVTRSSPGSVCTHRSTHIYIYSNMKYFMSSYWYFKNSLLFDLLPSIFS